MCAHLRKICILDWSWLEPPVRQAGIMLAAMAAGSLVEATIWAVVRMGRVQPGFQEHSAMERRITIVEEVMVGTEARLPLIGGIEPEAVALTPLVAY